MRPLDTSSDARAAQVQWLRRRTEGERLAMAIALSEEVRELSRCGVADRSADGPMSLTELLRRLSVTLDAAGVPYMLTGSLASTLYGEPRSTIDVDVVVVLNSSSLAALLTALPEDRYYVSADAARDAVRRQGQFNVIDLESGWKVDLILRKRRPFSETEFQRRVTRDVLGVSLTVCTVEDSILSKLEWARLGGGSERQLRDVSAMVALRRSELDLEYITHWAEVLEVGSLWRSVWAAV